MRYFRNKYIKMFESVDKLYTKIDSNEWEDVYKLSIVTNNLFFVKLVKLIFGDQTGIVSNDKKECYKKSNSIHQYGVSYVLDIKDQTYRILQLEDEWFYIRHIISEYSPDRFYKCDQWDGLVQCLKDMRVI